MRESEVKKVCVGYLSRDTEFKTVTTIYFRRGCFGVEAAKPNLVGFWERGQRAPLHQLGLWGAL